VKDFIIDNVDRNNKSIWILYVTSRKDCGGRTACLPD